MARGSVFKNPKKKEEMLILRLKNYSYERIAAKYGVDHTTVIYHCQQAGITLSSRVRNDLYDLIIKKVSIADIALKLGIPRDVARLYSSTFLANGKNIFSRRVLTLRRVNSKLLKLPKVKYRKSKVVINSIWWKMVAKPKPVALRLPQYVSMKEPTVPLRDPIEGPLVLEPAPLMNRIDERGVEWIADNNGGWVCMGMSKEARRAEEARIKNKKLELKRLEMLAY